MGAIGGLLGTSGGASGTGFSTPASANIQQGVTTADTTGANQGVNGSIGGTQGLLNALQGQNGVANQGTTFGQGQQMLSALQNGPGTNAQNVASYNTNALNGQLAGAGGAGAQASAIQGTGALAGQLAGANGVGAQTSGIQGLQNTASQLQGVANGTGPNPAMAALNQQTGQNVANQAALMAGQRGAGSNVGLLARQAAQQGAATEQQAVGQGATMQAQQQLSALGQMTGANSAIASAGAGLTGQQAGALAQQGALGQGAVSQQQAGLNSQFGQGTQGIAQQQAQQQINAGIAQNQVANTLGANSQVVQGNLGNQSNLLGGLGAQNSANVASQGSVNAGNTGLASTTMQGQQGLVGGLLNSAGSGAAALAAMADGGEVKPKKMASGGSTSSQPFQMGMSQPGAQNPGQQAAFQMAGTSGSQALQSGASNFASGFGKFLNNLMQSPQGENMAGPDAASSAPASVPGDASSATMTAAEGGRVPAMVSEGEVYVPPGAAKSPQKAASFVANAERNGGEIKADKPSQKAEKKGNSFDNDKIPKDLEEGGVVIPRSVMQSKDPVSGAAKFVKALMAKGGRV